MAETMIPSRQYCYEPEILYEYQWASGMYISAIKIAGALNLPTTYEINALRYNNTETRRIITMWSGFRKDRKLKFPALWQYAHEDNLGYATTAPAPPQVGIQNVTPEVFIFASANWCITQLIRLVPTLFPRCNLDTTPPELDAYEFFHAFAILRWGSQAIRVQTSTQAALPVRWHREPSTGRLGIPSPIFPIEIEEPATASGSANAYVPRYALPAALGDDDIGPPKQGAIRDYTGAREILYQFASKLCEQLQQVQLSVESDEPEKDENGSTQFAGIDGLVELYTQTLERSCMGGLAANNRAFGQLASHCAQMGSQSASETGRREEVGPVGNTGPGLKCSGKRFQAAPKTQISRRNTGVSKSTTRSSRGHNTRSKERVQAIFNSELAGTLNSTDQLDVVNWELAGTSNLDQLDAVNSNTVIELDSVIEVDLTED
ncbi:uncharacterized protein N7479_008340 [Penicillium vulpinum]|uniref:Uncharacterized protein n=1 Tax=Penicillium vulpinum TaxID=29845 RepID=A0A1V6R9L0_9EURO|nr:uncharacterized protein N7479_008340 [Penicillium vulpinum]KAJ5961190.1 hypothetical protein N7479_008340 [Penicillium vulpinum]OQD98208.1 hypothetical protein PENVUL_c075G05249 [Penicillium vulpinum]